MLINWKSLKKPDNDYCKFLDGLDELMAQAAKRPCVKCRKNLTLETYCDNCKPIVDAKKKKDDMIYDKKRGSSSERGYDTKWREASKGFLKKHKVCEYCGKPSQCVDHKIPHKGDKKLFWDRSNWAASCIKCNSAKAAKYEGGFGNKRTI